MKGKAKKKHFAIRTLLAVFVLLIIYFWHANSYVHFEDINMGISICGSAEGVYDTLITVEDIRYRELEKVKELCIGNPQNYTTLTDMKKCKETEKVNILGYAGADVANKTFQWSRVKSKASEKQIKEFQEGLKDVLPKLRKLKSFTFSDAYEKCKLQNIDFLAECNKLETVSIFYGNVKDYSVLSQLPKLKEVRLYDSDISNAEDLIGANQLELIELRNTPLSMDKKEVEKLQKAFPKAEIIINND